MKLTKRWCKQLMDGHALRTKIESGINDNYLVYVDTIDGSQHRVVGVYASRNNDVYIKLVNGKATIIADKVTAVRCIGISDIEE